MERTIIITDLTRFRNRDIVCTAGIDPDTGECIRPMPYLKSDVCKRLNIQPGGRLRGEFKPATRSGPHQEDYAYKDLKFHGASSSAEFRAALLMGLHNGVESGFEIGLRDQKHIPSTHVVGRSLITIRVDPGDVEIVEDRFQPGKIKLNFTDENGTRFRYIGITDLGFYDFAEQHRAEHELERLNETLAAQEEVLLRIGLSRAYRAPDGREGYWLQANGIYSFPDFDRTLRTYG